MMTDKEKTEFMKKLAESSEEKIRQGITLRHFGNEKKELAEAELSKRERGSTAEQQAKQGKRDSRRLKLQEEALKIAKSASCRSWWALILAAASFLWSVLRPIFCK